MSNPFLKADVADKDYDVVLFDVDTNCTCDVPDDQCCECGEYLVVICRLIDGSEITIAFDTVAYLLNDNGKTIEKIVSNYEMT